MKVLMFIFCILLTAVFVYDISRVNSGKALVRAAIDAAMIIAFAILERGRW